MTQPRAKRQSWAELPPIDWGECQTKAIADEVRRLRDKRSAQWLADRTNSLGYEVTRSVISDIENGRRRYVTTSELIVIAAALEVSPLQLLFGDDDGAYVDYLPRENASRLVAVQRFSGIDENILAEYESKVEKLLEVSKSVNAASRALAELIRNQSADD